MAEVSVKVTKGGGEVAIDVDNIPQNVFSAIVMEGLKAFVNKRMAKIAVKGLEGDELAKAQAAAMKIASENVAAILDGSVKLPGQKKAKTGVSGAVMTEARRIARNIVKDEIKREGKVKLSTIKASEITRIANLVIEANPDIIEQAKQAIAARESGSAGKLSDLLGSIQVDPELEAKVAEKKKASAGQLSAKQAGKVKHRPQATAH